MQPPKNAFTSLHNKIMEIESSQLINAVKQQSLLYVYGQPSIVPTFPCFRNIGNFCYLNVALHFINLLIGIKDIIDLDHPQQCQLFSKIANALRQMQCFTGKAIAVDEIFGAEYNIQNDPAEIILSFLNQACLGKDDKLTGIGEFQANIEKMCGMQYKTEKGSRKDFIINIDIVDHLDIQGALDMAIGNPVIATPNCIIIQLNRTTFEPNTHKTKKIFKKIYHNQTITIMTENDIVEYDIIAAICHSGMSPEHGHYVIYLNIIMFIIHTKKFI